MPDGAQLFKHFVLRDYIYYHNMRVFKGRNGYYRAWEYHYYKEDAGSYNWKSLFTLGLYALFNKFKSPHQKVQDDWDNWVYPEYANLTKLEFYKIELFYEPFGYELTRKDLYDGRLKDKFFTD